MVNEPTEVRKVRDVVALEAASREFEALAKQKPELRANRQARADDRKPDALVRLRADGLVRPDRRLPDGVEGGRPPAGGDAAAPPQEAMSVVGL